MKAVSIAMLLYFWTISSAKCESTEIYRKRILLAPTFHQARLVYNNKNKEINLQISMNYKDVVSLSGENQHLPNTNFIERINLDELPFFERINNRIIYNGTERRVVCAILQKKIMFSRMYSWLKDTKKCKFKGFIETSIENGKITSKSLLYKIFIK